MLIKLVSSWATLPTDVALGAAGVLEGKETTTELTVELALALLLDDSHADGADDEEDGADHTDELEVGALLVVCTLLDVGGGGGLLVVVGAAPTRFHEPHFSSSKKPKKLAIAGVQSIPPHGQPGHCACACELRHGRQGEEEGRTSSTIWAWAVLPPMVISIILKHQSPDSYC